jgi:flagellar motor switch protein FliN/FliY
MSDPVDYVPFETTTTAPAEGSGSGTPELERLYDVPVELAVEIGRTHMTIRETLALGPGSIVTLNRLAGEPVDLLVNGKPIARGEVVVIDEEFGLRVTEVVAGEAAGEGEAAEAPAAGIPAPAEAPVEPAPVGLEVPAEA